MSKGLPSGKVSESKALYVLRTYYALENFESTSFASSLSSAIDKAQKELRSILRHDAEHNRVDFAAAMALNAKWDTFVRNGDSQELCSAFNELYKDSPHKRIVTIKHMLSRDDPGLLVWDSSNLQQQKL